jgi:hypothetical protein
MADAKMKHHTISMLFCTRRTYIEWLHRLQCVLLHSLMDGLPKEAAGIGRSDVANAFLMGKQAGAYQISGTSCLDRPEKL